MFSYTVNTQNYVFDTGEIRKVLDGVDINSPEIIVYIKDMIDENITRINGGLIL